MKQKHERLKEHLQILQEEILDLENHVKLGLESSDKQLQDQSLLEVDCCKGILFVLISMSEIKR